MKGQLLGFSNDEHGQADEERCQHGGCLRRPIASVAETALGHSDARYSHGILTG
jgi:hypothetical protein